MSLQPQLALALGRDPKRKGTHGGARPNAGRPRITDRRAAEHHKVRPRLSRHVPQHVTLRIVRAIRTLRQRRAFHAIRKATIVAARAQRIRITEMSIQKDHIHLIVEADDRMALARGIQAFSISMARYTNRALGRAGAVFRDRYNTRPLKSPREVRNALAYVLNNWRHHVAREDHAPYPLDPYSSAMTFGGWANCDPRAVRANAPPEYAELEMVGARSYLLREGWRRHGAISVWEVPGTRRPRSR